MGTDERYKSFTYHFGKQVQPLQKGYEGRGVGVDKVDDF